MRSIDIDKNFQNEDFMLTFEKYSVKKSKQISTETMVLLENRTANGLSLHVL